MRVLKSLVIPMIASLSLGLAACTGGGVASPGKTTESQTSNTSTVPQSSAPAEKVTLRYLVEALEDAQAEQRLRDRLDVFEQANPSITIELQTMPWETMRTVLQTQLRSGDAPDVISYGSGPSFGGQLADAGLLYNLKDAYEANGWDIYDFAKDRVTTDDGLVYGIPGEMEVLGVFYNRDIFAKNGLKEPKNLADLEATAQKIKDSGVIPFAVSDQEGWQGGHQLSMALSSFAGGEGINAIIDGDKSWDSPEVVEAMQVWKDFAAKGFLPEFPTSVTYDNSKSMFYSGKAAMIPMGSWMVDGIATNTDFDTGFFAFPAKDSKGTFAAGLGSGPMITAGTKYPQEALKFLDFMASDEHGEWMIENLFVIPPFEVPTEGMKITPLMADVVDIVGEMGRGDSVFGSNIDVLMPDAFNEVMTDGIQSIYTNKAQPADVAKRLQEAADQ